MNMPSYLEELEKLGRPGPGFKPHQPLLLLAVSRLIKEGKITANRVFFDAPLRAAFTHLLAEYGSTEDRDRPYNPFFHLGSTSFWRLVPTPGHEAELENTPRVGGPAELNELVQYAELDDTFLAALRDETLCKLIESTLLRCVTSGREGKIGPHAAPAKIGRNAFPRLDFTPSPETNRNPFVAYLNSLQRLNASNENALAEFQACNPFFAQIHVSHPLTQSILAELQKPNGRQIILTGHAGDGKSTIAIDVYKQVTKSPPDQPLSQQLRPREDLPASNITILKDLSERRKEDDDALMREVFSGNRRFLIVSNTGALLDLFRAQAGACGVSAVQMESDVLTAISSEQGKEELSVGGANFLVINLARIDNLDIARQIFGRMVDPGNWATCMGLPCRANCPIHINVDLINHRREIVFDRLFLAYRRMYEVRHALNIAANNGTSGLSDHLWIGRNRPRRNAGETSHSTESRVHVFQPLLWRQRQD